MPDYDVQAVGLAVPAVSAPVTTYRPAVTVRNNGIHPANVSGICRMYRREPPGDLLQTWNLYLATLAAGNTGLALADGYWVPTEADIGRQFLFTADIVAEHDQVKTNDHLAPVTVIVTAGEPPEPPIVTDHATQHEEGGTDEIILDGLHGTAEDPQTPILHSARHQVGGDDLLDVTGLTGILAEGQPIAEHHEEHENHGGDELNVDELHGVLYNLQKPQVHANEAHDPNYAPNQDLVDHKVATQAHQNRRNVADGFCGLDAAAEVPSANLAPLPQSSAHHFLKVGKYWVEAQEMSERSQANGYPSLDASAHVPAAELGAGSSNPRRALHPDGNWRAENRIRTSILDPALLQEGAESLLLSVDDPTSWSDGSLYTLDMHFMLVSTTLANSLKVTVKAGRYGQALSPILTATLNIGAGLISRFAYLHGSLSTTAGSLYGGGFCVSDLDLTPESPVPSMSVIFLQPVGTSIRVYAELITPGTTTQLWCGAASLVHFDL